MKYHQLIFHRLPLKLSWKFLLIFSICILVTGGIVWACADGDYDDGSYSNFSPEAFVDHQYSPFFYTSSTSYYGDADDDSNTRFNGLVLSEWDDYLNHKIDQKSLKALLFNTTLTGLDSVSDYRNGKLGSLSPGLTDLKQIKLDKRRLDNFLSYLILAKKCESFTVNEVRYSWDEKVPAHLPDVLLGAELFKALDKSKDPYIKERLWFQAIRYQYFKERSAGSENNSEEIPSLFKKYGSAFPKNMTYYRTLGYLAGHYFNQKDYSEANYLYSLCYNFSSTMKIPSKWSFHPQNEDDWNKSLSLAKTKEEKATLWQMLGLAGDEARAIEEIYAIDPQSEKLELLLSRLINMTEISSYSGTSNLVSIVSDSASKAEKTILTNNATLVGRIARNNNTAKPCFWNLAAGYLNYLNGNDGAAESFYTKAKIQLPKNDKLIIAQYKILDWTLYLSRLKTINAKAESEMVEPITWLANLRDGKDTIPNLRYNRAVTQSISLLGALYKKQGELLKSNCFDSKTEFYTHNENIESLKALLSKREKTPFEVAMLRYYHLTIEDLYYHQALMLVYQEKIDQAILLMSKSGKNAQAQLLGNPFSIHINDCHDCDFEAVQKKKYTPLSFLNEIKILKTEIAAGKNTYVNTFLLADAYYNITHYGNARTFYQSEITGQDATSPLDIPEVFRPTFTSAKLAEKYYLRARLYAKTKEQKARCTFMAAKCERNDIYNAAYNDKANQHKYYWDFDFKDIPSGKYFAELKNSYQKTQYYQEILKECGYFNTYIKKN
ncbi:hypothetical protein [Pedobacter sp. L105]|uniref:hypothetical protein n=1 Tax=Pedobacter sp. L105 TaxID=1641871 RepID=UPI00131D9A81|nr:hypothetical protein [Pedobacter sp. L105]